MGGDRWGKLKKRYFRKTRWECNALSCEHQRRGDMLNMTLKTWDSVERFCVSQYGGICWFLWKYSWILRFH